MASSNDCILPAISQRSDVRLSKKTRVLHTTETDPKLFDAPFRSTDITCGDVIRRYFCTAIHLGCDKTALVSMDGRSFKLKSTSSCEDLTAEVTELIGGMHYGRQEHQAFTRELRSRQ